MLSCACTVAIITGIASIAIIDSIATGVFQFHLLKSTLTDACRDRDNPHPRRLGRHRPHRRLRRRRRCRLPQYVCPATK